MIRLPNSRCWNVEEWIFRGFLEDARPHLREVPELAQLIHRASHTGQPELDLGSAGQKSLRELKLLVMLVRRDNLRFKGRNFADPDQFPVYLSALEDLLSLATE